MNNAAKKLIADAELKTKMKELRAIYGKAPDKETTAVEMDMRCHSVADILDDMLESYTDYVGARPDRIKTYRSFKASAEFPRKVYNDLEALANPTEKELRLAPLHTQEGIANLLSFNAEYLERIHKRDEIKRRSAAEWRKMERGHITRSDYTITDLYSDYKDMIEESTVIFMLKLKIFGVAAWSCLGELVTWDDYRQERKKWRSCKHRFCLNVFPVERDNFKFSGKKRRRDAKFCCDTCKYDEKYAKECYEKTAKTLDNPTYLPDWFYEEVTEDWRQKRTVEREVAAPAHAIERQINKNKPIRYAVIKKDKPPVYECVTRKLSDVTPEQLEAEKWENAKKMPRISELSGEKIPVIVER